MVAVATLFQTEMEAHRTHKCVGVAIYSASCPLFDFSFKAVQCKTFHITDSYVCMSVVAKGRSGSRFLNRLVKSLNAVLLIHGVTLVLGHVESSSNRTDHASRET